MADFLESVVFIKDPTVLPDDIEHTELIDALSKQNKLVILLSHGNKYDLPPHWILPPNVRLLEYDLDTVSIQATVVQLRDLLKEVGVDLKSRYTDYREALPLPLAGALIQTPMNVKTTFINNKHEFSKLNVTVNDTKTENTKTDWDLI